MSLKGLASQVSRLVNSDTYPRPTTGIRRATRGWMKNSVAVSVIALGDELDPAFLNAIADEGDCLFHHVRSTVISRAELEGTLQVGVRPPPVDGRLTANPCRRRTCAPWSAPRPSTWLRPMSCWSSTSGRARRCS